MITCNPVNSVTCSKKNTEHKQPVRVIFIILVFILNFVFYETSGAASNVQSISNASAAQLNATATSAGM